jgi:hypothetical protein
MKTLIYYLYYRISSFYEFCEGSGYRGGKALFLSLAFNALSLISVVLYFTGGKLTGKTAILVSVAMIILSLLFNKSEYEELCERWKHEKHRQLKGWLIFIYWIASLASFFVITSVLDVM